MKSFKNHIAVIFPLVILLFSIEFAIAVGRIVTNYEITMSDDYNIIIVCDKDINETTLRDKIDTFKQIIVLDTKQVLDRLKDDVSAKNLQMLEATLPKFYSLKLNAFPSSSYMEKIKSRLLEIDGVRKVETFSKTHDKIYKILVLFKSVFEYFTILIALIGIALIFKQMRIWLYEHRRRIEVMTDLGAPYWLKSAMLYKIAIIDSAVATALICLIYAVAPNFEPLKNLIFSIGFELPSFDLVADGAILFCASIIASIISVSFVMMRSSEKQ